jgi:hypothetical protein
MRPRRFSRIFFKFYCLFTIRRKKDAPTKLPTVTLTYWWINTKYVRYRYTVVLSTTHPEISHHILVTRWYVSPTADESKLPQYLPIGGRRHWISALIGCFSEITHLLNAKMRVVPSGPAGQLAWSCLECDFVRPSKGKTGSGIIAWFLYPLLPLAYFRSRG